MSQPSTGLTSALLEELRQKPSISNRSSVRFLREISQVKAAELKATHGLPNVLQTNHPLGVAIALVCCPSHIERQDIFAVITPEARAAWSSFINAIENQVTREDTAEKTSQFTRLNIQLQNVISRNSI
jgi:hypothetical protein